MGGCGLGQERKQHGGFVKWRNRRDDRGFMVGSQQAIGCKAATVSGGAVLWYAGCVSVKDAKPMSDAIDGGDGISWHLPLPPLDASSLEPYSPGQHCCRCTCLDTAYPHPRPGNHMCCVAVVVLITAAVGKGVLLYRMYVSQCCSWRLLMICASSSPLLQVHSTRLTVATQIINFQVLHLVVFVPAHQASQSNTRSGHFRGGARHGQAEGSAAACRQPRGRCQVCC